MAGTCLTRARVALLVAAPVAVLLVSAAPAHAGPQARPETPGDAVVMLIDRVSFEDLLSVPQFRALARAGGAALMTTKTGPGEPIAAAYRTIWNGSMRGRSGRGSVMARALSSEGVVICTEAEAARSPGGSPVALVAADDGGASRCRLPPLTAVSPGDDPDKLRSVLEPRLRGRDGLVLVDSVETLLLDLRSNGEPSRTTTDAQRRALLSAGELFEDVVQAMDGTRVLAMAVSALPSREMNRVGDEVTPLVMGVGDPTELFPVSGPLRALTSATTRQTGLVSNVDVAPTILSFFGGAMPPQVDGLPITFTASEAPFTLHRRHLEHRRIRFPIQIAEVTFVSLAGLVAVVALLVRARRRVSPRAAIGLRLLALCGLALPIAILGGGTLPKMTYATVVPFMVITVLAIAALSLLAGPSRTLWPVTFIGVLGLSLLVLDAALGGRALRMPLLGGTMFDGVRFYGLPNAFIGLLLSSTLFLVAAFPPVVGTLGLLAAGVFAGFPSFGANVGAAITLFAAAGLWPMLRIRRRLGVREIAFATGLTVVGLAAVLVINRWLAASPTHVTRFVERAGDASSSWDVVTRRLATSFRQVADAPAALIPLLGLLVLLVVVLREPSYMREVLRRNPAWRDVLIVLVAASVVAFFANDTGLAAAAPSFLYAMALLTYLVFLEEAEPDPVAELVRWLEQGSMTPRM